jgi:hypothetical protein
MGPHTSSWAWRSDRVPLLLLLLLRILLLLLLLLRMLLLLLLLLQLLLLRMLLLLLLLLLKMLLLRMLLLKMHDRSQKQTCMIENQKKKWLGENTHARRKKNIKVKTMFFRSEKLREKLQ